MGITDLAVDQSVLQSCCLIQAVVLVLGIRENINCCSFSLYFLGSKKFPLWVVGFLHSLYSDEICVSQSNSSDFTLKNNPLVAPRYFIPRNWVWMEQGQFYIICRYLYSPHFGPHWTLVGDLAVHSSKCSWSTDLGLWQFNKRTQKGQIRLSEFLRFFFVPVITPRIGLACICS